MQDKYFLTCYHHNLHVIKKQVNTTFLLSHSQKKTETVNGSGFQFLLFSLHSSFNSSPMLLTMLFIHNASLFVNLF